MVIKEHPIFGKCEFNVDVDVESNCSTCSHLVVCKQDTHTFCENYVFATSEYLGCGGCLHRFTKWARSDQIPCFKCKHEAISV